MSFLYRTHHNDHNASPLVLEILVEPIPLNIRLLILDGFMGDVDLIDQLHFSEYVFLLYDLIILLYVCLIYSRLVCFPPLSRTLQEGDIPSYELREFLYLKGYLSCFFSDSLASHHPLKTLQTLLCQVEQRRVI